MIRLCLYVSASQYGAGAVARVSEKIQPIKVTVVISALVTEVAEYREKGPT